MKRIWIGMMSILVFLFACGFNSEQQKVYDNADILTKTQEESLNQMCIKAAKDNKADFAIVTVESLDGKTAEQYAADFYNNNGFGYEQEEGTGTIFLVSISDRKSAFFASGDCYDIFSQSSYDKIIEDVNSNLSKEQYYEGLSNYVDITKEYIKNGGKSNNQVILDFIIQIIAALVVASIVVWIMYSGSKSKMSVNGYTYASGHRSEVLRQHDVFQRTTTVRRHIERNPKGGNGGHIGGNRQGGSSGSF